MKTPHVMQKRVFLSPGRKLQ